MALEPASIAASAQRLQQQRDRASVLQQQELRAQRVRQEREQERLVQERLRADATSQDIDRARLNREQIRSLADRNLIDDAQNRAVFDNRVQARIDREQTDLRQFYADIAFERQLAEDYNPLQPLAPSLTSQVGAAADARAAEAQPRDVTAERDSRIAERAAEARSFALQQAQDYVNSQRNVDLVQSDPSSLPDQPARGGIVDFQA